MARREKEIDIGWNYGKMVGNDHRRVKCNYCAKQMHGGVTRLKEHLAGVSGDVAPCKEVPKEVREEMKKYVISKRKDKQAAKIEKQRVEQQLMEVPRGTLVDEDEEEDEEDAEDIELRRVMKESRQIFMEEQTLRSSQRYGTGSSSGVGKGVPRLATRSRSVHIPGEIDIASRTAGRVDSFMQKKQGKSQSNIKAAMKGIKDAKKHIGRAISKFFYYNHIPHNVASSPYYQPMVDAIADVGRGVPPPTPWEISHTYLDNEVDELKTYVESYGAHWDEYGCTLMCDGWSTQNRRKIINFLVYSTSGTVFLKSVDATDEFQNADYICSLMDNMVMKIGESRVVQVITDNGANYKKAGQQLMLIRKNLYWTPCAAHCIDLIFLDMSKDDGVKNIISQCQKMTGFIYNHGWVLSLMRRETKNRELIRPAITLFATHFIALDSIYLHRDDLRRMITAREWAEKLPRLNTKDKKNADDVYRMIFSDEFWKDVASVIAVFEPLVKVLRLVDSDDKADMGYLYEAMDRAKEAIKKNVGRSYRKWWGIIDQRWDKQLHQDIHAAGYFLNPRFQYSSNATIDNEVLSGFKHVVERMEPDIMKQLDIHKEVESYRMKAGVFYSEKARIAANKYTPAQWWSIIAREHTPNLASLAMRILSQTVSSSNCERNWTTFSLIHTKIRNRLTMDNVQKLVFVHYNMRLRERHARRQAKEDKLIDLDHIFHEDDPLLEWTREVEDRLLDDRDNSWLDEAIQEDAPITTGKASGSSQRKADIVYKRKKVTRVQDDDTDSSDADQGHGGGGGGETSYYDTTATGVSAGSDRNQPHWYEGEYDHHRQTEERMNEPYGGQYDQRDSYNPVDSVGYRHSDYIGDYAFSGEHGSYSNYTGDYAPTGQQSQPSPYDNMMVSFLGQDQMQYCYPSYYYTAQGDDNDDDGRPYAPARNSFWG